MVEVDGAVHPAACSVPRAVHSGGSVSALLGRIPSAVGYQPTLATDLGLLQERITTNQKGSITSVQTALSQPETVNPKAALSQTEWTMVHHVD
ncbi:hypothetical protein T484DRAFT_1828976 [Baffinella frigidus]|nr:hypothetical protein T484DRAFT_1828976 [Cryptophyta sp. CCMP2293]